MKNEAAIVVTQFIFIAGGVGIISLLIYRLIFKPVIKLLASIKVLEKELSEDDEWL